MATLLIAVMSTSVAHRAFQYAVEDVQFWTHPSSQMAYEFGKRHFDASNAFEYDLPRAKRFFYAAIQLDPNHPSALQEIARTSFVSGNVEGALAQINLQLTKHPDSNASAYYIRALAYGYLKNYEASAKDFETFIRMSPLVWAAYNDLAWTRLQEHRPADALVQVDRALAFAPENAWLLTTRSAALFELGRYTDSRDAAVRAAAAAEKVTPAEWVVMYKGNDPASIPGGIASMRAANVANLKKIDEAIASSSTGKK